MITLPGSACNSGWWSYAKRAGLTGVWTATDHGERGTPARPVPPQLSGEEAKIAALGVHISRGVTSHGFALNVNTDLDYFNLIVPCGIASKPVTSMAKELGRQLPMQDVAHSVSRIFGVVFQSQILWLETLDTLLGYPLGVPMKPPAELRKVHKEEDTFWV